MAIYHLSVQIIGRSNGGSAVASSAYRATEKLHDETTNETFDYRRKEKAIASGIIAPKDSPEWANDRAKLWNEVEKKENRKNSAFCREMNIAIPAELKNDAEKIIQNYIKENFTSCGLVADYAIHKPNKKGDERNIHAHIMITKRAINKNGWCEMYRVADDYKTKRIILNSWRESWEEICNKELERIGSKERISCETLANQGIEREAQQHMGKTATAMQRKGKETRRKKYESEELPPLDEIKITENELFTELSKDEDFKNLLHLFSVEQERIRKEKKAIVEKLNEEEKIKLSVQKNVENIINLVKEKNTDYEKLNFLDSAILYQDVNSFYHYVKKNEQPTISMLKSILQPSQKEKINTEIKSNILTVRKIGASEKMTRELYPEVYSFQKLAKKRIEQTSKNWWNAMTNWCETTDFKPVVICRNVRNKLRQIKDDFNSRKNQIIQEKNNEKEIKKCKKTR